MSRRLEAETFVTVLRAADHLLGGLVEVLKRYDLTPAQYNVLRILRGAGDAGLACGEIGGRMIARDPDITRLLDRLEARGQLARVRDAADRRVVRARIAPEGLRALEALDRPVEELHRRQFGALGAARLRELLDTLRAVLTEPPRRT